MNKDCTIMLIDDDQDDQLIFVSAIEEINARIECRCFDNAVLGMHALQNHHARPACIFLDLNLPLMHGFDFLRLIKSSEAHSNIPVVVYSTSSRNADKTKAEELGAFHFLTKQNSVKELKRRLTALLNDI